MNPFFNRIQFYYLTCKGNNHQRCFILKTILKYNGDYREIPDNYLRATIQNVFSMAT